MSGDGSTAGPPAPWRLEITGGGTPTARQTAALAAAATVLVEGDRSAPVDPRPAAYRSRWRRAAMLELSEIPVGIKDTGAPWGGTA